MSILSVFVLLQYSECVFHVNTWTPSVDLVVCRRPMGEARKLQELGRLLPGGLMTTFFDYHGTLCGVTDGSI